MKNAFITGLILGILSGAWLFIMHAAGSDLSTDQSSPIEYVSILIPIGCLFFGLKSYRDNELGGKMGFLEALIQCFKILVLGGVIAVFAAILYFSYVSTGAHTNGTDNISAFSGRMFGALLVGLLSALGISVLLTTKSNKVD